MASKLGLMLKREAVDDRLRSATNRLQSRGVDVGSFPDEGRDRDVKEYDRIEHVARLLEACIDRLDEMKAESATSGGSEGYDAMTVKMLREELTKRAIEIPKEARKKDDLVALLAASDEEGDGTPGPNADTGAPATPVTPDGEGAGLEPGTGTVEVTPDGGQAVVEPREGSNQQPGDVVESPE